MVLTHAHTHKTNTNLHDDDELYRFVRMVQVEYMCAL